MKLRLAFLFALAFASSAQALLWIVPSRFSASSAKSSFTDDFSGTLSNWTTDAGSWTITIGRLVQQSSGFSGDLIHYNTACTTTAQYCKFQLYDENGGWNGPRFRVSGTSGYRIDYRFSTTTVAWYDGAGSSVETGTLSASSGDYLGFTITGTGTSTVVKVWLNPTGAAPDAGGATWGGAGAALTFTNNPGSAVDSGSYIGLFGSSGSGDGQRIDNFSGGDIP